MATGIAGVLDDDRVRQPVLARPFADDERYSSCVRQNRDQRDVGIVSGKLGQFKWQAGTHDDGVGTACARLPHGFLEGSDGAHHIDGQHAVACRNDLCGDNFAVQCDEIGVIDGGGVAAVARCVHQIGMAATQVDACYGSKRAQARHIAGQPVRGNAHAHAPLDDGQQRFALDAKRRQRCGGKGYGHRHGLNRTTVASP